MFALLNSALLIVRGNIRSSVTNSGALAVDLLVLSIQDIARDWCQTGRTNFFSELNLGFFLGIVSGETRVKVKDAKAR